MSIIWQAWLKWEPRGVGVWPRLQVPGLSPLVAAVAVAVMHPIRLGGISLFSLWLGEHPRYLPDFGECFTGGGLASESPGLHRAGRR